MSSTGNLSGVKSSPTTAAGEENRKSSLQSGAGSNVANNLNQVKGIVRDIVVVLDEDGKKIKGRNVIATTEDGKEIANGKPITLDYLDEEFLQTVGEVQRGDVVRVTVTGIDRNPLAKIVGRSGEGPERALPSENKVALGPGPFLFPPGIGIG